MDILVFKEPSFFVFGFDLCGNATGPTSPSLSFSDPTVCVASLQFLSVTSVSSVVCPLPYPDASPVFLLGPHPLDIQRISSEFSVLFVVFILTRPDFVLNHLPIIPPIYCINITDSLIYHRQ